MDLSSPTLQFGRHIGRDDYLDISLLIAQGSLLLWQSVKFGGCLQTSPGTIFTFASAFDNILVDRKSTFKRLNGNYRATLRTNLVSIHPIISELQFLPRFARNFMINLHLSLWHSEIDWKIVILISAK